ncbi:energy transducer TonB [Coralloluteibacterium thermophilus]|uniref:Protein TonB n=1 Tax=Coralloluteibacterium thermophilum TaxID=2707049 RepID=A0ABV9NNS3_9GAMM
MTDAKGTAGVGGGLRVLAVALGLALVGCGSEPAAPPAAEQEPTAATPAQAEPAVVAPPSAEERDAQAAGAVQAAADALAARPAEELRESARIAQGEQRLYAPSGDNAAEYYLALREKTPDDPLVENALGDLFPYILIAAEQNIARSNLVEAQRLLTLMTRIDPNAPALRRVQGAIEETQLAAERRAEAEAQRLAQAEAQRQAQQAAAAAQAQQQAQQAQQSEAARLAEQLAEAQREIEAARAEAARLAEERAAAEARARELAAQGGGSSAPAAPSRPAPAVVSAPAPDYPREALRAGITGEVTVEFTVQPDGSVSDARVVSANPTRTFDREAISAVRRWQFESTDEPVVLRRTIAFRP